MQTNALAQPDAQLREFLFSLSLLPAVHLVGYSTQNPLEDFEAILTLILAHQGGVCVDRSTQSPESIRILLFDQDCVDEIVHSADLQAALGAIDPNARFEVRPQSPWSRRNGRADAIDSALTDGPGGMSSSWALTDPGFNHRRWVSASLNLHSPAFAPAQWLSSLRKEDNERRRLLDMYASVDTALSLAATSNPDSTGALRSNLPVGDGSEVGTAPR
ncbi:hypothetical protein Rhopal_002917-T1 [Rhodotorula paludigena]|uniref:Uncharacterized protein n=1 Tax=Rhodotorula paludigena TaxID=86838 RepID=A0AAV5GIA0_9BASI|nr:hypothetical protein Rhopal_002917-T1 [Rhodotorula paludigena]